jgi:hypothetical protein
MFIFKVKALKDILVWQGCYYSTFNQQGACIIRLIMAVIYGFVYLWQAFPLVK